MYKGEADWSLIAEVKNNPRIQIPIFGNGDIDTPQKALEYRNRYGVDGIMIGRASIGYPWIFRDIKAYFKTGEVPPPPTIEERVDAARKHLVRSVEWKGKKLGVLEMRRHYTNYFKGLPFIKEYRSKLVMEEEPVILLQVLDEIAHAYAAEAVLSEAV
jgi:tRNA-dihydrouridine synthase